MAALDVGKPRLGKDYYGDERSWHFYQERRHPDYAVHIRLCDRAAVRLVYFAKGESVRVCKKCLRKAAK